MDYILSVIIPVYNGEKFINNCCECLINQTLKQIQIIFIDDGSKDRTKLLMDECAERYKNVIVLHQNNQGVSVARNYGLSKATGKYIGFMDVDDKIEKDLYEVLVNIADENNLDIVGMENIGNNGELSIYTEKNEWMSLFFQAKVRIAVWNKIYKREYFDKSEFPIGIRVHEDLYVVYSMLSKVNRVGFINIQKYHYQQREGSSSRVKVFQEKYFDAIKIADIVYSDAREKFPELYDEIEARKAKTYLRITKIYYLRKAPKKFKKQIDDMKWYLKELDKSKLSKYFIKTDIIRFYLYLYFKPAFLLMIKTIDRK